MQTVPKPITNDVKTSNLKKVWNEKKRILDITQQTAAEQLGITQGAFSQYLNGHCPLNEKATMKIAKFLGVHPEVIDPNFKENVNIIKRFQWKAVVAHTSSDAKKEVGELIESEFDALPLYVKIDKITKVFDTEGEITAVLPKESLLALIDIRDPKFPSKRRCKNNIYAVVRKNKKSYSFICDSRPPAYENDTVSIYQIVTIVYL